MSKAEILAELPRLDHAERREVARRLFGMEADAHFQMLDAMEARDAQTQPR